MSNVENTRNFASLVWFWTALEMAMQLLTSHLCIKRCAICHEEPTLCTFVWEVPTSGMFAACSSSVTVMRLAV